MASALIQYSFCTGSKGATLGETDSCDPKELGICVEKIPKTPVGLPKTKEELDTHCRLASSRLPPPKLAHTNSCHALKAERYRGHGIASVPISSMGSTWACD
ncbi:hypothetical protein MSG28_009738 [Choristoneura fumiferana]|uniref:Uncharacterized protein n=1 Tax=Choristoneura fumiferana TaxID=7141 RepID=A0ACC0JCB8_CHOFU|nr:hypothetical protein MSG28_009738 [Choristoneura fumiferana]